MRAVVQRVKQASVAIDQKEVARIGPGLVVFLGIQATDGNTEISWLAGKIINLRIFNDKNQKMNRSLKDLGAEMLIVSQFTLYGDCRKGRRPGYSAAAPPEVAEPVYNRFVDEVRKREIRCATGKFQALMDVSLVNDGPVTLLLDSEKRF